jgi:hypothetical protein
VRAGKRLVSRDDVSVARYGNLWLWMQTPLRLEISASFKLAR